MEQQNKKRITDRLAHLGMKQALIILLLIRGLSCFSQDRVSSETYQKALDILTCKVVTASLSDSRGFEAAYQNFVQRCPCEATNELMSQVAMQKFLRERPPFPLQSIDLCRQMMMLGTKPAPTLDRDSLMIYLTEAIFVSDISQLRAFAARRQTSGDFEVFQDDLAATLEEVMPVRNHSESSLLATDSLTNPLDTIRNPFVESKDTAELESLAIKNRTEQYGLLALLGLCLSGLIFWFWKKR
jgi:hypothetical protein